MSTTQALLNCSNLAPESSCYSVYCVRKTARCYRLSFLSHTEPFDAMPNRQSYRLAHADPFDAVANRPILSPGACEPPFDVVPNMQ